MPAPIVLSTLTPETKKVVNPPQGAPKIATISPLRDGSRPEIPDTPTFTLSSTADSITASIANEGDATSYEIRVDFGTAVSGLTVNGLVTDQVYQVQVRGINYAGASDWSAAVDRAAAAFTGPDPTDGYPTTWETEPDWDTILTVTGNGTPDPLFDPATDLESAFTYLGAFRIPYFEGSTNTRVGLSGTKAMTLKPADGSNGPNGSLFIANGDISVGYVAELQIPDLSMDTNHLNLNPVTILQTWESVFDKTPTGNVNGSSPIGWIKYANDKLYLSGYNGYDNDGNDQNVMILDNPSDLINSTAQGFFKLGIVDAAARYVFDIPAERQATFGGTLMSGICCNISIISRSSFGHSMFAWDPPVTQAADTEISSTTWTYFPASNKIDGYSVVNGLVSDHYGNLLAPETNLSEYVSRPIGTGSGERTRSTFEGLPLPDPSLRKHAVQEPSGCGVGFFVPGTDTIMFIGNQESSRFGGGYKNYTMELGPDGRLDGGYGAFSKDDYENCVWLWNANDVANRVNSWDPHYYHYQPKNNFGPFNGRGKNILTGFFDSSTSKLWLMSFPHAEGKYTAQAVVSVFQVGVNV